jgi:hypothetical protein
MSKEYGSIRDTGCGSLEESKTLRRGIKMSSDDLTRPLADSDKEDKVTQPTITAVFRLLREVDEGQKGLKTRLDNVESGFNTRLDNVESKLNGRFDGLELRITRDFASVDTRFAELSDEMKKGFQRLSDKLCDKIDRSRLHAEADYEDLLRRIRDLESKAS